MECPHCNGEINEAAKKCKHCGEWLQQQQQPSRPTTGGHTGPNTAVLALIAVLLVGLIGAITYGALKGDEPVRPQPDVVHVDPRPRGCGVPDCEDPPGLHGSMTWYNETSRYWTIKSYTHDNTSVSRRIPPMQPVTIEGYLQGKRATLGNTEQGKTFAEVTCEFVGNQHHMLKIMDEGVYMSMPTGKWHRMLGIKHK
jgi:hypothetical protein